MTKTIESLLILLATISDLLPVLLFAFFFKVCRAEKSLDLLATSSFVLFLLNTSHYILPDKARAYVYPLFTVCEFFLFAFFLRYHIRNLKIKAALVVSSGLFLLFSIIEFFFIKYKGLDSVMIGVESIVILIFSFYYLYEQMNDVSAQFIYNKFHFWIVAGLMIYLAGSFFIYVFANQVDKSILQQWWVITVILYIVKNIFFVIAIGMFIKQKKYPRKADHQYYPYLN